jgi:hypothetical protein
MSHLKTKNYFTCVCIFLFTLQIYSPTQALGAKKKITNKPVSGAQFGSKTNDKARTSSASNDQPAQSPTYVQPTIQPTVNIREQEHLKACQAKYPNDPTQIPICLDESMGYTNPTKQDCKAGEKEAKEAYEKITKACSEIGSRGNIYDCWMKVDKCDSKTGAEDFNSLKDMAGAFGIATSPFDGMEKECPKMSGKDFFERQKDIKDSLKDSERDLDRIKKDLANTEADSKRNLLSIQAKIAELQKNIKEKRIDLEREQRKKFAEMADNLNKTLEQLKTEESTVIRLELAKNSSLRTKATKLIALSDAMVQSECAAASRDFKAKLGATQAGSMKSLQAGSRIKRNDTVLRYDACVQEKMAMRKAIIDEAQEAIQSIDKQIRDSDDRMSQIRSQIASLDVAKRTEVTHSEEEKQNLENDYNNNIYLLQQELINAQQEFFQKKQAGEASLLAAQQHITSSNNELLRMGTGPNPAIKSSVDDAKAVWDTNSDILNQWKNNETCCPQSSEGSNKRSTYNYCKINLEGSAPEDEDDSRLKVNAKEGGGVK